MRRLVVLSLVLGCGRAEFDRDTELVDDAFEGEFAAGTFVDTRWVVDHVELEPGALSGTFVSRIFDSDVDGADWGKLRWSPGAPYGKPLPDGGVSESGYRSAAVDMTGNVLLAHFDDTIVDSSPTASSLSGTALGAFAAGKFGAALADTAQGYVHTKVTGADSVFNFGTDSFSWSLWAKSTAPCPGNAVYLGIENPGTGLHPHLWLGCTPLAGGPQGTIGNTMCSTQTPSKDCVSADGSVAINDGAWHHLAIVKEGHASGTLTAYVDGAVQGTQQFSYRNPIVFDNDVEFAIGAFSEGTYPASGTFDEAAVFRRALSREEILALYRRGAVRLTMQVRACDEPTCALVPFAGPSGDPARSFVDPANASGPPTALPILAAGRYVQYQVRFERDDPALAPALYSVGIARAE